MRGRGREFLVIFLGAFLMGASGVRLSAAMQLRGDESRP